MRKNISAGHGEYFRHVILRNTTETVTEKSRYQALDRNGEPYGRFYADPAEIPVPEWFTAAR